MANDVKVVIALTSAVQNIGFGYPLIFAGKQTKDIEYTEVSNIDAVKTAGFDEASDVYKAAQLLFSQANAPSRVAVCASTETTVETLPDLLEKDWRQLIAVSAGVDGESTITEIADYIESCDKYAMFFTHLNPTDDSSVATALAGKERTFAVAYRDSDVAFPEAAVVGATSGLTVGSFTYKNIVLQGVTPQTYTDAEIEELHKDGIITILKKAGSIVTSEGVVLSGEYADIIDARDYIISQIEYQCQALLNRVPKLPYDNKGIASLEGVVLSVLKEAADNGMIAENIEGNYDYSVEFALRSDCPAGDISSRQYNRGKFSFTLNGAIHTARINGEIIA